MAILALFGMLSEIFSKISSGPKDLARALAVINDM
jgi:hypothetical protein